MDTVTSKPAKLGIAALMALCLGGTLAADRALAQQDDRATLRTVCKDDYKKHCPEVMPGGGAIAQCFMANMDKLTPECRAGIEAWKKSKEKS